ncbi:unnamed protein product [Euphydryas editha]|uniref:Uncharacterized protein n=1 Tax=Euphydryas editha TaxID=104508 RepID=A0AAU9TCG9_EUPED|nr:unnamed protein product [Euphydryas editha]
MIVYLSAFRNDVFSYWKPSRAVHGPISLNTDIKQNNQSPDIDSYSDDAISFEEKDEDNTKLEPKTEAKSVLDSCECTIGLTLEQIKRTNVTLRTSNVETCTYPVDLEEIGAFKILIHCKLKKLLVKKN